MVLERWLLLLVSTTRYHIHEPRLRNRVAASLLIVASAAAFERRLEKAVFSLPHVACFGDEHDASVPLVGVYSSSRARVARRAHSNGAPLGSDF